MMPRDANLKGENYQMALVRPELIIWFNKIQTQNYVKEQMKLFNDQLIKDRAEEPKLAEGETQFSEEQKAIFIKRDQEETSKKMEKITQSYLEAPKAKQFNVNVFRQGVKFDMPEDEIKKDEAFVEELGKFLVTDAMTMLVNNLKSIDSAALDSEGLTSVFHKMGINMRYLGKVLQLIKDQKKP